MFIETRFLETWEIDFFWVRGLIQGLNVLGVGKAIKLEGQ
jgi:hypothetical protein